VLLFLPGLLSDLAAILLLIPWSRALLKLALAGWFRGHVVVHSVTGGRADDGVIDSHVVRRETGDPPEQRRLEPPRET
jgi:UPF0716 family protein affecting phage T7 exclusion